MSLFQCLVSLYPNRGLPPPSVFQKEKEGRGSPGASGIIFLHCDMFFGPKRATGLRAEAYGSSEPWELDLLDCEDVIYSCNLFGDCGRHQWSSLWQVGSVGAEPLQCALSSWALVWTAWV